jgi:VanZ family protein
MNIRDSSISINIYLKWRILFSLPAIILSIAIFLVSDMSQPPCIDFSFDFTDKILHFFAYFGYGTCLIAFYIVNFQKWSKKSILIGIIIFGAIYGMSDEFHQYFVPGRECDFFDWLADFAGIVVSILFLKFIKRMILKIIERVDG